MSGPRPRVSAIAATVASLLVCPPSALACPVCFGASDSPLASGMNAGIGVLLVVTVCVLATAGMTALRIARRARSLDDAEVPGLDDVPARAGEPT